MRLLSRHELYAQHMLEMTTVRVTTVSINAQNARMERQTYKPPRKSNHNLLRFLRRHSSMLNKTPTSTHLDLQPTAGIHHYD
jgi:hypothetical protein